MGMDKDILKKTLAQQGLPVVPAITLHRQDNRPDFASVCGQLDSTTLFIKPAIMGSSVGVSKAVTAHQYEEAVQQAFQYSTKVLVEKAITGRELECAVLGNADPRGSCVGEVKAKGMHEFYSYEAKYIDPEGAELIIPCALSTDINDKIRALSVQAFQAIECKGLARVDFFMTQDEQIYINELNTIPGFTNISMYPKLWIATGLSYTDLITRLIALAHEEFETKQAIMLRPYQEETVFDEVPVCDVPMYNF
jgi:D-alanine-D-alanine ligase